MVEYETSDAFVKYYQNMLMLLILEHGLLDISLNGGGGRGWSETAHAAL